MSFESELCELLSATDTPLLPPDTRVLFRLSNRQKLLLKKTDAARTWVVAQHTNDISSTISFEGPESKVKALLQGTDEGVQAAEAGDVLVDVNPQLITSGLISEEAIVRGLVYSASLFSDGKDVRESFVCGDSESTAKRYRVFGIMPFQDLNRDHATAQEVFDAFRGYHFISTCTSALIDAYFQRTQVELKTRVDYITVFGRRIMIGRWILGMELS